MFAAMLIVVRPRAATVVAVLVTVVEEGGKREMGSANAGGMWGELGCRGAGNGVGCREWCGRVNQCWCSLQWRWLACSLHERQPALPLNDGDSHQNLQFTHHLHAFDICAVLHLITPSSDVTSARTSTWAASGIPLPCQNVCPKARIMPLDQTPVADMGSCGNRTHDLSQSCANAYG